MARQETAQLNIRSAFALCGYASGAPTVTVGTLVRRGPVLVRPASDERRVSLKEANVALDAARKREP